MKGRYLLELTKFVYRETIHWVQPDHYLQGQEFNYLFDSLDEERRPPKTKSLEEQLRTILEYWAWLKKPKRGNQVLMREEENERNGTAGHLNEVSNLQSSFDIATENYREKKGKEGDHINDIRNKHFISLIIGKLELRNHIYSFDLFHWNTTVSPSFLLYP